jgi:hypothetical protein
VRRPLPLIGLCQGTAPHSRKRQWVNSHGHSREADDEDEEPAVVVGADTVPDEGAVMVEHAHALAAHTDDIRHT